MSHVADGATSGREANHRGDDGEEAQASHPVEHSQARKETGSLPLDGSSRVAGEWAQPHLHRTFKLSNDPNFESKLIDVVGLYLNPPEHAMVFSVDEKSQIQAFDRTQPGLPIKKGRCGTMTRLQEEWHHDAVCRNGHSRAMSFRVACRGIVTRSSFAFSTRSTSRRPPISPSIGSSTTTELTSTAGDALVGKTSTISVSLHSHEQFIAERRRAILPRPDDGSHSLRQLHQRP
jgi:hypothetical protein